MTIEINDLNIWAIIVCIIIYMAIGALWYAPKLFGNIWLKLVGKTKEDISKSDANKSMMLSIIPAAITVFLLAHILGFANTTTAFDALIMGTIVSIGIIGMSTLNLVFFEGRSLKLTGINVAYPFVALNIAAIILTYWQ